MEMTIHADPLYQHLLLVAEKKFWGCRPKRRNPSFIRGRAAAAAIGSGPGGRHERVQ